MITRYTADPSEISIVDRPACPSAVFFDIHKRDGSIVRKSFKTTRSSPMNFDRLNEALRKDISSLDAVRKIHAAGATPEDPIARQRMAKLRKGNAGRQTIDLGELARSIRAMKKGAVVFPPQSSNAFNDNVRADDGARLSGKSRSAIDDSIDDDDDDMDDEMYNAQGVTGLTGNNAMLAAQVSAIKRALKRKPGRFGA
jgi:hypothetical protein